MATKAQMELELREMREAVAKLTAAQESGGDAKAAPTRKEKERFFQLSKVTTSGGAVMLAQGVANIEKGKRPNSNTRYTTKRIYADAIPEIVKTVTGHEMTAEQLKGFEKWNVPTQVQS